MAAPKVHIVTIDEVRAECAVLRSRLAAKEQELGQERRAHSQTIQQRDAAEEALSQAYFMVTGKSPEWSNLFGYTEALDEIHITLDGRAAKTNAPPPSSGS